MCAQARLDFTDPEYLADPYPAYQRVRETRPTYYEESIGAWVFTRYADVAQVLRDPRLIRPPAGDMLLNQVPKRTRADLAEFEHLLTTSMPFSNPPRHTTLRRLVEDAFSPRAFHAMRPRIRQFADELFDRMAASGRVDFVTDFAYPLPTMVISEFVGVPAEDREVVIDWVTRILAIIGQALPSQDPVEVCRSAAEATEEFCAYLRILTRRRRRTPREDLLTALVNSAGEISEAEIVLLLLVMLGAGLETTAQYLGNGMLLLLRHPDKAAQLRANPMLAETAAEELLRYDGPTPIVTPQQAAEDVLIGDHLLCEGEWAVAVVGAANRDPDRFTEPERIDLRRPLGGVLSFGGGVHACLGAGLARLEAQIAFTGVVQRFPSVQLDEFAPPPVFRSDPMVRGLESLRIDVGATCRQGRTA